MAPSSLEKHFRGHRDFAKACRDRGFTAVQCVHGRLDNRGLPGLSVSIRRTERLRMEEAMAQTAANAGGKLPVLAHRSSRQPWRITMDLDTFFLLYRTFMQMPLPDPAEPADEPYHDSDPAPARLPVKSPDPQVFSPSLSPMQEAPPQTDIA